MVKGGEITHVKHSLKNSLWSGMTEKQAPEVGASMRAGGMFHWKIFKSRDSEMLIFN